MATPDKLRRQILSAHASSDEREWIDCRCLAAGEEVLVWLEAYEGEQVTVKIEWLEGERT